MYRKLAVVVSVLVLLALVAMPAQAGVRFCSSDPVFDVAGRKVSVNIDLAPSALSSAITPRNPVRVVLLAPAGTNPRVVSAAGEFPEAAEARERPDQHPQMLIGVAVPNVVGFEALRVSVYVDDQLVRQKEVSERNMVLFVPLK
jgi:hypothetical protein